MPPRTGAREARSFDVEIEAGRPAFGRLTIGDPDHPEGTRRVQAETCGEVADALALVVALAIDPRTSMAAGAASPAHSEEGSPPVAEAPVPPPIPPAAPSSSVDVRRPPAYRGAAEESHPRNPPAHQESPSGLMAGLDAALDVGVSPVVLVGLSANVGWQSRSSALFSPALRVAFDRAASGTIGVLGGTAAFTWTVGRVDACPVARIFHDVRVSACARIEVGVLDVAGGDIAAAQTKERLWLSTGALARGEWSFFETLFLNVEAGGSLRETIDRFKFLPDTTVYQVPLVGLSGAAGLGAHFL